MLEKIREAAEHIKEMNLKMREKAVQLRSSNASFVDALEKDLINTLKDEKINGSLAAVDGGLLAQEMHGTDIVIARATAAVFEYEESKLVKHEYFPNAFPEPEYDIKIGFDEREIMAFRSLFRLKKEIECAISVLEKKSPECLMMDGSLLPLTADKPLEGSDVFYDYQKTIGLYKKLYSLAEEKKCLLLGVIKDSRSKRFVDIVRNTVDIHSSDTFFLNNLLSAGERTFSFKYTADVKKHPITRDFGADAEKIHAVYVKAVDDDVPLRVELLGQEIDKAASLIYSLSKINKNYAYPAILIEADLRAALDPIELERTQKSLAMYTGMRIAPLRRNSRPFR
ncbi:DNA double-strand break repair nuclease NurA [Candidatus Micrarchaeota archaeon]|nr:DNA double-strand break repair nuclease NurA [Candidatus Micrarchaeota archaeon]